MFLSRDGAKLTSAYKSGKVKVNFSSSSSKIRRANDDDEEITRQNQANRNQARITGQFSVTNQAMLDTIELLGPMIDVQCSMVRNCPFPVQRER